MRKLYITLRRSFAGTRETQCSTLESLGLRYREQTVVQNNTESVRGAILKVSTAHAYALAATQCDILLHTQVLACETNLVCCAGAASCLG